MTVPMRYDKLATETKAVDVRKVHHEDQIRLGYMGASALGTSSCINSCSLVTPTLLNQTPLHTLFKDYMLHTNSCNYITTRLPSNTPPSPFSSYFFSPSPSSPFAHLCPCTQASPNPAPAFLASTHPFPSPPSLLPSRAPSPLAHLVFRNVQQ